MEHWVKKIGKIDPKHVENTFGHFWKRISAVLECWIFLNFGKIWRARPCMEHGANFFSKKLPQNMFKTSFDNFGNDAGHFCVFEFFLIFRKLSMTPWNTGEKNFFKKNAPKHVWTLGNVFGHFGTLKLFWFFSSISFKYLPQNSSPENWTQIFWVRKTELIFLGSGIWTQSFESRTSEMELRILTVAWMQKECLLSNVSQNWTLIFNSGKLNSFFLISRIWTHNYKSKKSEKELRTLTVALMHKKWLFSIVSEN